MASGSGNSDIWWFIGILAIFFLLWVSGGGPQRAEEQGLGEVKIGQKYTNQNQKWSEEDKTPTSTPNPTPSDEPKYSRDGQIIY